MKKNIFLHFLKIFSTGGVFVLGGILMIYGVIAFDSTITSTPSESGFQSNQSLLLSKLGGTFNRETMSMQALSEKLDSLLSSGNNGFLNCETFIQAPSTSSSLTALTCSAGKSIRSHAHSCAGAEGNTLSFYGNCGVTAMTTTSLTGRGDIGYVYNKSFYSASILCCDD